MPKPERFENELTEKEKRKIWEYSTVGLKPVEIAKLVDRHYSTVWGYINARINQTTVPTKLIPRKNHAKLTAEEDHKIAELRLKGNSYNEIARIMNLNPVTIRQHGREYIRKHGLFKKVQPTVTQQSEQKLKNINSTRHDYSKLLKEFKEYLKTSTDIQAFNRAHHLTKKTYPPNMATYNWFKQITSKNYTETTNRDIITPKALNKVVKPYVPELKQVIKVPATVRIKDLEEWLKHSDDLVAFTDKYKLTHKTRPTKQAVYYWFEKIKGISYLRYKLGLKSPPHHQKLYAKPSKPARAAAKPVPGLTIEEVTKVLNPPLPPAPLSPLEQAIKEAELESLHLRNRELKAHAEVAEMELRKKLKEQAQLEKECRTE